MDQVLTRKYVDNGSVIVNIRSVYTGIIALLPVIMIYNVPIINKGISTVLLAATVPFALIFVIRIPSINNALPVLFLFLYMLMRSGGDSVNAIVMAITLVHVLGVFGGSVDAILLRKVIEKTAVLVSILVIIQTVCYYALGFKVSFLIRELILSANQGALLDSGGTLYRPSALFLEPSHFAQYAVVALMSVLFPSSKGKANVQQALLITFGCLLTTSGMGIALCATVFLSYLLFNAQQNKSADRMHKIMGGIALVFIAYIVLMRFSFFSDAMQRIVGEVDGYNAIWGRTLFWDSTVGQMSGRALFVGYGSSMLPSKYMTGLMEIIYCYGYIGLALLGITLLAYGIQNRRSLMSVGLCFAYAGLMVFANLYSFISLAFWLNIIGSGQFILRMNQNMQTSHYGSISHL